MAAVDPIDQLLANLGSNETVPNTIELAKQMGVDHQEVLVKAMKASFASCDGRSIDRELHHRRVEVTLARVRRQRVSGRRRRRWRSDADGRRHVAVAATRMGSGGRRGGSARTFPDGTGVRVPPRAGSRGRRSPIAVSSRVQRRRNHRPTTTTSTLAPVSHHATTCRRSRPPSTSRRRRSPLTRCPCRTRAPPSWPTGRRLSSSFSRRPHRRAWSRPSSRPFWVQSSRLRWGRA
mmetsp:Transcript_105460/g.304597  ORF Transcript_105460/g.304597 Transcript_105460/m.304597 type:complete len:234 (-) Transcript_105460:2835-3536(-)